MANNENTEESILEKAAKKIGEVAGKVAAVAGAEAPPRANTPKKEKVGKLVKKNKSRLPRKEKKALQKAAAKQAGAQQ
jgi:hypothetical protein